MQAGLIVGNGRHPFSLRIVGMSVGRKRAEQTEIVSRLVDETRALLNAPSGEDPIEVSDIARGPGYGRVGGDTLRALSLAARLDGILLDPVYTAKAFAGLLTMGAEGSIPRGSRVLFIHSGGAPALFAYPETLSTGNTTKGDGHAT